METISGTVDKQFGCVWSNFYHFKANSISKLIDTCPDLEVKGKLYNKLGYILKYYGGKGEVLDIFWKEAAAYIYILFEEDD